VKHFKWEPRGKRRLHKTPAQREADACRPWLLAELEAVGPAVVVALGGTAARSLTGSAEPIARLRGQRLHTAGGAQVIVTYHPSALLRAPEHVSGALRQALVQDLAAAGAAVSAG
jgi:DNA polymerase